MARNPGQVCLDYVEGRRKRYINPFAFLLVPLTGQFLLSTVLERAGWTSQSDKSIDTLSDDAITWMLFALIVPLALLWTRLFSKSNRNLAENYVLGLYLLGLFAWIELVLLPFSFIRVSDAALAASVSIAWLSVVTWAGVTFYSMPWYAVLWRIFISTVMSLIIFAVLMELATLFTPAVVTT